MKQFDIPWQVQVRMLAKRLTKDSVCEKLGINKRTFYLSITGRQSFNLELVKKLAEILECNMEDLLEEIPQKYK